MNNYIKDYWLRSQHPKFQKKKANLKKAVKEMDNSIYEFF